jgi:hypothetical protein
MQSEGEGGDVRASDGVFYSVGISDFSLKGCQTPLDMHRMKSDIYSTYGKLQ